jgi:hypothetical protein
MSRLMNYLIETKTDEYGDFLLEGVSRSQIQNIVDIIISLEKILPVIIDSITNPKYKDYLERFHKQLSVVGDILQRK